MSLMTTLNINKTKLPVRSPAGWSRVNQRMKMETPVFWIPVSMAIAITSSTGRRHNRAAMQPKAKPNHGKAMPVKKTRLWQN